MVSATRQPTGVVASAPCRSVRVIGAACPAMVMTVRDECGAGLLSSCPGRRRTPSGGGGAIHSDALHHGRARTSDRGYLLAADEFAGIGPEPAGTADSKSLSGLTMQLADLACNR
jgi:hypothetical protein